MAVILVEGFDAYNGTGSSTATSVGLQSRWLVNGDAPGSMVAGRFGGQALRYTFSGNTQGAFIPVSPSSAGSVGVAVRPVEYPRDTTRGQLVGFSSGTVGARQLGIILTLNGALAVIAGSTLYTTADGIIPLAQWSYIEAEFLLSDTVGYVNLYVNGASVGSVSNVDTKAQTSSTFDWFLINNRNDNPDYTTDYDDVYLTNTATRLGEQRVVTVVPTSDGTPSQWAASGGVVPPYTMVDEVLCNADVDYIFDGTVNDRAVFNMASTGATPVSVSAVQIGTFSRKTDTGTRAIQLQYVDSGGTAYDSASQTLGSNYIRQVSLLETNPATATAWTPAEANTLKTGVKVSV